MARTGENIYCRRDGRWEGKYIKERIDGKIKYGYVSGKSYEEVLSKKRALLEEEKINQENIVFSSLAEEWLTRRMSLLKYSSVNKYRNILNNYLIPQFGKEAVTNLTRETVSAYFTELTVSGGHGNVGLSPKYISDILVIFREILGYAGNCKNMSIANFQGITIKKSRKPLRILSVYEQKTLEQYLMKHMNLSNLGILLCLYTGIRLGELCALKWKDISFQDRTLYIHSTMTRIQIQEEKSKTKVMITLPKSDCSMRFIPLPDKIFEMIRQVEMPDDAYFLTGKLQKFIEPRTMENRFKAVLKSCDISNTNFHTLRHTFATRCIELNFDVKTLSEILGHASVKITMDRYVHPSMETKQRNMDKLSEILSGK